MIIKPAVYKKVMVEQKRLVEEEVYGCDFCQKEFTRPDNIDATLHYRKSNKEAENINFCSWNCFFNYISKLKLKEGDFISSPFIDKENINELLSYLNTK